MIELIERIVAHGRENPAKPLICGKNNVVTYVNLADAIANICARFEARHIERGSKVYVNIRGTDLRLAALFASIHYGMIPFIVARPDEVPGEVDYDLVLSATAKLAPEISGDIEIDGSVFDGADEDINAYGGFERRPDDLALVGVTSGSTGIPKLLAMTFRQIANRYGSSRVGDPSDRTMLTFGSTTFLQFGMVNQILMTGSTIVRSDINPATTLRLINLFLVDRLVTSPKTLETLMSSMDDTGITCPSISMIRLTGSLFDQGLLPEIEKRFDAKVNTAYGLTETGLISEATITSDSYRPSYVGEIVTKLGLETIRDEETGDNRFQVRNDPGYVLRQYRGGNAEEDLSEYFAIPDTGYIEGNSVYVLGRADEVYNFSGTKFAFSDLNQCVMSIDKVVEAAVLRDPDDPDPFGLKVAIVRQEPVDFGTVIDVLCRRLGRRTARRHIRLYEVPELPRNSADKVDRRALIAALKTAPAVNA